MAITNETRAEFRRLYLERRKMFPCKLNGTLTNKGGDRAMDYLVGLCMGMQIGGATIDAIPTGLVFLCSVNGADYLLDTINEDGTIRL